MKSPVNLSELKNNYISLHTVLSSQSSIHAEQFLTIHGEKFAVVR